MRILLMLFAAPMLQIILSTLRINGTIRLNLIAMLSFCTGIFLTFWLVNLESKAIVASGVHCGLPQMALALGGIFITVISIPVIGVIGYLCYRHKQKQELEN